MMRGTTTAATLLLVAALLCCAAPQARGQATTGFLQLANQVGGGAAAPAGAGPAAAANATASRPAACQGTTPANVIIESVTPLPAPGGKTAKIELRNAGGMAANITGWRLFAGATPAGGNGSVLYIADAIRCKPNGTIPSGQSLVFTPRSDTNPCGFPFQLGANGSVSLADYEDKVRATMQWDAATEGTQIHVPIAGDQALRVPAGGNVIDVLKSLGNYGTFLLALQTTGLDQPLTAASDPNYAGPTLPAQQFVLDLPWWFGGAQAAAAPPPPPAAAPAAPAPVGIPAAGPYTLLAPTDEAFDNLLTNLGGANGKLPLDALLRQPTLKDILLYHIVPGAYTSQYLRNNTAIFTAKGVEVVPIVDGCQTEGKIALHDSCVDKPTGDNFTCAEQKAFGKCEFPFMVSALAAQWQGGFCQRTCLRCDCSPGSGVACSIVQAADVDAANGVVHGISRVLFPPPLFTKEQAVRDAVAYNESLARNQSLGIPTAPGLGGLNEPMPGAAPGAGLPATTPGAAAMPTANSTAAPTVGAPNTTEPAMAPASPSPAAAPAPAPGARRRLRQLLGF